MFFYSKRLHGAALGTEGGLLAPVNHSENSSDSCLVLNGDDDGGKACSSGLKMDGVLESTIALCGCKVLCSFLCLPAFKRSISSVSLCCVCLLLFTDLCITSKLSLSSSSSLHFCPASHLHHAHVPSCFFQHSWCISGPPCPGRCPFTRPLMSSLCASCCSLVTRTRPC